MHTIQQSFSVRFSYPVHFTERVFSGGNTILKDIIKHDSASLPPKVYFVIDDGVSSKHPRLLNQIHEYAATHRLELCGKPLVLPGGEQCKNNPRFADALFADINRFGIDRHSYLVGIGGGALLDLVGYVAAIGHRGIRHIRIPTTVLSQNDSGVGVKNGINAFGKKNFLGTFAPPFAVINDFSFLTTLHDRDWRSGIAEAVKVALIKDAAFFQFIQTNAGNLVQRDMAVMQELIYRCAQLHLAHIAGGDPFEMGSSRPLDFGHWASHKLEGLTNYEIRHGEAVAVGICLDSAYSHLAGLLPKNEADAILHLIKNLGFTIYFPELSQHLENPENPESVLSGLKEFREHLGGRLTVMLLERIGKGVEAHDMDFGKIKKAISELQAQHTRLTPSAA